MGLSVAFIRPEWLQADEVSDWHLPVTQSETKGRPLVPEARFKDVFGEDNGGWKVFIGMTLRKLRFTGSSKFSWFPTGSIGEKYSYDKV